MKSESKYKSKTPDENGIVAYSQEENDIWADLYGIQHEVIRKFSCEEFVRATETLDLRSDAIPQVKHVSEKLKSLTGWEAYPVPALIGFDTFFELLASKRFPVATFIRNRDDMEYIEEPDIFHEVFGHCTMLTNPIFAEFVHKYGLAGKNATHEERVYLARLFWFTVEFGLVHSETEVKTYGAGLNSSPGECEYSVRSRIPERRDFNLLDVLRTPYRIDVYQPIYYVLDNLEQLLTLADMDLLGKIQNAKELGDFEE